jgi:hypothetical protein
VPVREPARKRQKRCKICEVVGEESKIGTHMATCMEGRSAKLELNVPPIGIQLHQTCAPTPLAHQMRYNQCCFSAIRVVLQQSQYLIAYPRCINLVVIFQAVLVAKLLQQN